MIPEAFPYSVWRGPPSFTGVQGGRALCSDHGRSGGGDDWAARLGDTGSDQLPPRAAQLPAVFAMTILFWGTESFSPVQACLTCGTTPLRTPLCPLLSP